jgi:hypothetical protein
VGVVVFLLLTPIVIELDSEQNLYQIRISGIARMNIIFGEPFILIKIHAFGFEKIIDPMQMQWKRTRKERLKRERRFSFKKVMQKGTAIIRTFEIRYINMDIDTDDYALNALLYPFALLFSQPGRQIQINFHGENALKLKIVNNMERMLLAFIR